MVDSIASWLMSIPLDCALWVIVVAFIALDVIVGTVQAFLTKTVSSEIARKGIMHKLGYITAMLVCSFVDVAQQIADFGFTVPVLFLCSAMIVTAELYSLCEHAQEMNPDIDIDFLHKKD